jgi:hypothetical protein
MLPHYIPLSHRFLQPWMKLSKCTIKTSVRSDISGPLVGFQRGWSDMSDPLAGFQRGWSDVSGLRPRHVRVSEGIGLPIYRPIFGRFPPAAVVFLAGRPTVAPPSDSWLNPVTFHPAATVFFGCLPALAPCPVYQLSRRLPPNFDRFLPRRCRF